MIHVSIYTPIDREQARLKYYELPKDRLGGGVVNNALIMLEQADKVGET